MKVKELATQPLSPRHMVRLIDGVVLTVIMMAVLALHRIGIMLGVRTRWLSLAWALAGYLFAVLGSIRAVLAWRLDVNKEECRVSRDEAVPQEPIRTLHTVGPDYPGVTGTPARGTRDMDRVREEEEGNDEGDG